jgi:hypothetical protein
LLDRPLTEPTSYPLKSAFPEGLRLHRSDHFSLWAGPDQAGVEERLDLLERVYKTFDLTFTALGFDLATPHDPLVVVHVPDPRNYADFLKAEGAGAFLGTTGYYHTVRRLVVTRPVPPFEAELLALDSRTVEVGTAAHELVHLLVAVSGLAPTPEDFPLWLHEGLAMQFEPAPEGTWAGPAAVADVRLAHWRSVPRGKHQLRPLLRDEGLGHGYQKQRYAEAWSFVHFLWRSHPEAFVGFLDRLRLPGVETELDPDRVEKALCQALGSNLGRIEAEWLDFVGRLRTCP